MRWRLLDKIVSIKDGEKIIGVKSISLEEASLLDPLGREGFLPESLLLESLVELSRWFVIHNTRFRKASLICSIKRIEFNQQIQLGEVINLVSKELSNLENRGVFEVRASSGDQVIAEGEIELSLISLHSLYNKDELESVFQEIYDKA